MKYLLTQQIRRITMKNGEIKVYPGNAEFIKLANKLDIEYTEQQIWRGEYLVTRHYLFEKEDYFQVLEQYKKKIEKKRTAFHKQDPLVQLIKLLRYIFKRNTRAKEISIYSAIQNAYSDKTQFLKRALNIAQDIDYSFFQYGFGLDPSNEYHCYIYYFEIQNVGQVSFHSDILFDNIPEFPGEWSGIINEKFPFNLRDIKKLIRSEV